MTREELGDLISRAICPDAWKQFDADDCSNEAGWAVIESIRAAGRVLKALETAGLPIPARKEQNETQTTHHQ